MLNFLKKMSKLQWILLLVLIVLAGGTVFQVTESQPATCNICHEMNFFYKTYYNSTHPTSGVTCIDCHTEPGVQGFVAQKWSAVSELVLHITGNYKEPINTDIHISNPVCLRCHDANKLTGAVNHTVHLANNVACQSCHANVAHAGEGEPSVIPLSQCETCHQNHKNFPLTGTHGTLNCTQCHSPNTFAGLSTTCTSCHNVQAHTTFPLTGTHTSISCTDCHTQVSVPLKSTACSSCHTPPAVHPNIGNKPCSDCHNTIAFG